MHRASIRVSLLAVALLAVGVAGGGAVAHDDATPAGGHPLGGHPLVGTWVIDPDPSSGAASSAAAFAADGTYSEIDPDGASGLGAWRATGERTADVVIVFPEEEGSVRIRASVEADADGRSFAASYTFEFLDRGGTGAGEYGPGEATAVRLEAEGPGTPVGTLQELFTQFEQTQGTPAAATPAA